MATYRDPVRCFAPLEVIERLLEIRVEAGYCLPYISFPPMIWQTISMHMASTFMLYRRPKLSFTLAIIVLHWRRAVRSRPLSLTAPV